MQRQIYCQIVIVVAMLSAFSLPAQSDEVKTTQIVSLDGTWRLATDAKNVGRQEHWFESPRPEAKPARVPWIIQEAFPGYHGVAWYWRTFDAPANPHPNGRTLLRFWAVDYLAEVWLNGVKIGGHEGSEGVFVLDATDAVKPGAKNLLAVRVLNPVNEPIDGIILHETPARCKQVPFVASQLYNDGGIVDSVELLLTPSVYTTDVFAAPNWKTGDIAVRTTVHNASAGPVKASVACSVAPAHSGGTTQTVLVDREFPNGDTVVETVLHVDGHRLWNLNDPNLYRVTARVRAAQSTSADERSVRCGFRDFRYENGYFRLNGKRLFLKSSHTSTHYPVGLHWPHDPDLARRDLLLSKAMGFNAIRFFCSVPTRYQIDLCDELGLMIYEESFAGWQLQPSPKMAERFDREVSEMIVRDRNHPCVVMWGLLNETSDGDVFRHAVGMLPLVRSLDASRIVMLDSGLDSSAICRFGPEADKSPRGFGAICNPGDCEWEDTLADIHPYKNIPHTAPIVQQLRTECGKNPKNPVFASEYGVGSGVDFATTTRHFEQLGVEQVEDAQWYRERLDRFMVDWKRWNMEDTFASPEEFFELCLANMGKQRLLGLNALRSNPKIIGHNMTGTVDQANCGEGLFTTFRDLKRGTIDCVADGWAPLRWCLFVEPVNAYRHAPVRCEAVLANEDMLKPGKYPVRIQIVGPDAKKAFDRTIEVAIPDPKALPEPPFAIPVFQEDIVIDGPAGKYRFLATFERGAAAVGGTTEFYVADPAELPKVEREVVLWGNDPELQAWCKKHGVQTRPYAAGAPADAPRALILAAGSPPAPGDATAFRELAERIARGSAVVFLTPSTLAKGDQTSAFAPLAKKGELAGLPSMVYHKDEWNKRHPIFDGLPSGGLMDYVVYREVISRTAWVGQDVPAEVVAGATNTSQDYSAGLTVSVNTLGAGKFILNSLLIRENLGNPVADRILLNMLCHASRDLAKPPAALPADFPAVLKSFGY